MTRAADDGGPHWQVATLPAVPGGAIPSTRPLAPPPSPAGTSIQPGPSLLRRPRRGHPLAGRPSTAASGGLHDVNDILTA
jgi:hypothetical protein